MPKKDAIAKFWSIVPSFDGLKYLAFPLGDKPSGYQLTPTLLGIDDVDGSLTGGESGLGNWLTLFGYSLGRQSELGTSAGARVYFRNPAGDNLWHEVGNYRSLEQSRSYKRTQAVAVTVQLGSLGSPGAGAVLDVKINVAGVDTNILTGAFTVQPGNTYFVSLTGNDATGVVNDIAHPFRYWQQANGGTTFTGIWATLGPGDTIVPRGGTWTDQVGFEGRLVRLQAHSGSLPTGATGHGYIKIRNYPGPILGNAPEYVHVSVPAGGAGGIHGCSTSRAAMGYGKFVSISGLHIECDPTVLGDAGPINLQAGADGWRVHNCELGPWMSTRLSPNNAKAGGVAGQGDGVVVRFNHIHDIGCDPAALENHGIYCGDANDLCAQNWLISHNRIEDVPGGSTIQWNNTVSSGTFDGMKVHNNFLKNCAKYNVNLGTALRTAEIYNNVLEGAGYAAVRVDDDVTGRDIKFTHNTIEQASCNSAYKTVFANTTSGLTHGSIDFSHNILVMQAGHDPELVSYTNCTSGDTAVTMTRNLYFDADGVTVTVPTIDGTGLYSNPLFVAPAKGNYTVAAGSPALGACNDAEPLAIADDFYGIVRPVTGTGSPGATKNDIGAMQGVGT